MPTYRNDTRRSTLFEICVDADAWERDSNHTDHTDHKTALHEIPPGCLLTFSDNELNTEHIRQRVENASLTPSEE